MSSTSIFDTLCNGNGGRLALGSTVLIYLIGFNETSAPCAFLATFLATIYGAIAARCKSSLRTLQMPYIRASNKFDFSCLFLATWLDVFAVLCACGALARTLSICLDAMTGGLARILILGRNSPSNEPWPDVLGVAVVFLLTGMFMLGLEHSKAFSLIMSLSMFGLNAVLSAVGWWNGDTMEWTHNFLLPNGVNSLLTAAALLTFSFPADFPSQRTGFRRFTGLILTLLVCVSILLAAGCLSTIVRYKPITDYIAAPLFTILDNNNFHKLVPVAACLLMLTTTGALLELFPELYGIIARFATVEWRVLSKQISYENSDSGNPVLAVFIAGSLCATLAFACPLQHLSYMLAAAHLCAGFFRAFYLLYTPFRPKFIQHSASDSSLSYSRLSTAPAVSCSSNSMASTQNRSRRSLWNLSMSKQKTLKKAKSKAKNKKEVEKEWLLLGEPQSPIPQRECKDMESTILSDGEPPPSDFEYPEKFENSDSDSSTDIDAIVDEYRQKVKVTTAGTLENTLRVPTLSSWHVTIFALIVIALGIALTVAGIKMHWAPAALTGSIGVFIISCMMNLIPKNTSCVINVSPVLSCASIMLGILLLTACIDFAWPAVLIWTLGGLLLLLRCDNWCCNCFEPTTQYQQQLIHSVSAKTPTNFDATSIRMPRAATKSLLSIPARINVNNR